MKNKNIICNTFKLRETPKVLYTKYNRKLLNKVKMTRMLQWTIRSQVPTKIKLFIFLEKVQRLNVSGNKFKRIILKI